MTYMILRVYNGFGTMTERTNDFCAALRACETYLHDPDCIDVKIWDVETGKIILDYWRD